MRRRLVTAVRRIFFKETPVQQVPTEADYIAANREESDEPYFGQVTHSPGCVSFNRSSVTTCGVNKVDPITRRRKRTKTDRICRRDFYSAAGELVADDETPFDKEKKA